MADPDTPTEATASANASKPVEAKTGWFDESKELVKTIVYAVLIALGFRSVAYEPFNIPSESMLPGLLVGDYLFVSKFPYGYSRYSFPLGLAPIDGRLFGGEVKRGDVIVFKLPADNSTDYIKRVIGLPGDVIEMRQGVLHINGQPVRRERVEDFEVKVSPNTDCAAKYPFYRVSDGNGTVTCRYPQFRETLPGGRSYLTLDLIPDGPRDTTRPYFVPAGHYFVMGDNRDDSADSRMSAAENGVGFLPAENIVGRAEFLFFSTNGEARLWTPWKWHKTVRWNRLFQAVE
ncbi:signal peptidase I [Pedomonas sp. V897]|uniref:signal peptidase I n=1 Tax=Pedomonas sp. V897 TaxID=3446482 RepID=UPI003EE38AB5